MNNPEYNTQAKEVAEIIDIAINSLKKNPPEDFSTAHIEHFINTYLDFKNQAINPEPRFKNIQSLTQLKNESLIYFQEGSGKAVDEFWKTITEKNIPLTRKANHLNKMLKRGKIKNKVEYDWLIDTYNSHTLSQDEVGKINDMIAKFENGK
jgi:hypothetical protein